MKRSKYLVFICVGILLQGGISFERFIHRRFGWCNDRYLSASPDRREFSTSNYRSQNQIQRAERPDSSSEKAAVDIFSGMEDPQIEQDHSHNIDPEVVSDETWFQTAIGEIHEIIEHLLDLDRKEQRHNFKKQAATSPPTSKKRDVSSSVVGLRSVNPEILLEKSEYLCKEGLYEAIMSYRFNELEMISKSENSTFLSKEQEKFTDRISAAESRKSLQRVHAFLQGFILSEKKSRARLKINYLLAGAEIGQMEEAISNLSQSEEIDEFLFSYLSQLINAEQVKLKGVLDSYPMMSLFANLTQSLPNSISSSSSSSPIPPSSTSSASFSTSSTIAEKDQRKEKERQISLEIISRNIQELSDYSQRLETEIRESPEEVEVGPFVQQQVQRLEEVEELIGKSKVLKILLLIEKRLLVEKKFAPSQHMRLLGELLNLPTSEERVTLMKKRVNTIEGMESFEGFLSSGVEYLQDRLFGVKLENEDSHNKEESKSEVIPTTSIDLSPEKLQIMKELLFDLQEMRKRLLSGYEDSRTVFQVKSSD